MMGKPHQGPHKGHPKEDLQMKVLVNLVYVKDIGLLNLTDVQCIWSDASFFTSDKKSDVSFLLLSDFFPFFINSNCNNLGFLLFFFSAMLSLYNLNPRDALFKLLIHEFFSPNITLTENLVKIT